MNTLRRRRMLFGKGTVTVTFNGNGGQTATGDVIVAVTVPAGTAWKNILKPEFYQIGTVKGMQGFTAVADDDDTLIDSNFVVTNNIATYASYTAIEIGVVTHHGAVYSKESWTDRYARRDSPDTLYVYDAWDGQEVSGYREGYDRGNLIEFVYYKIGEKVFALRSSYEENGKSYGSYLGAELVYVPNPPYGVQDALSDIIFYADGINNESDKIPSVYFSYEPREQEPDDFNKLIDEKYGDGKRYMNILHDKLTGMGYSSPLIESLKQQADPFGAGEHMYVASIHEAYLVAQNREKFHSVFKYIDKTLRPVNGGTDSGNVAKYLASYGGDTGEGFSTLHDRLYGSFMFGSSNLYYRHDGSTHYYWRTCGIITVNGNVNIMMVDRNTLPGLFVITLSELF